MEWVFRHSSSSGVYARSRAQPPPTCNQTPCRGIIRVWDFENRSIVRTIEIPSALGTMDVKLTAAV
jgi:hypothetical protein